MKTRVAIIIIVVAVAAVAFVIVRFPGPKPPAPPPSFPPSPKADVGAATPVEAVVLYVEALYRKDYEAAYEGLSSASQRAHPYEQFLERAETGQATNFDLAAAEAGEEVGGRVTVTVPLVEDPAEAGFTTMREGGKWKVVFIGGEPWFPYAEEQSGRLHSTGEI
ncbi:MAG TPA: hypothetical protein VMY87_00570 [Armatimonadota bacterium]|nr:hypothetical protein [Armatimonadota bacterium]